MRDRLLIQVLDDSTDDTTRIARRAVAAAHAGGVGIELRHRTNRNGYKAGALADGLQHTTSDLIALFDADFVRALSRVRRDVPQGTQLYRVPVTFERSGDRTPRLVNVAAAPLRTTSGTVSGTIVVIEDITSRVQLEEQLQISEKMASIGLLAAGVAHEVNTPLTGISSFTQMLLEQADPDKPRTKLLEKIERQTFRAAKIVNGLLNLARPSHGDLGPVACTRSSTTCCRSSSTSSGP